MKESGIIMSQLMIKAYMDGRKTQTRRLKGLKEINENPDQWKFKGIILTPEIIDVFKESKIVLYRHELENIIIKPGALFRHTSGQVEKFVNLPYGFIGDSLYFKETWMYAPNYPDLPEKYYYKASKSQQFIIEWKGYWKPSIFMPKEIARFKPIITNVKVERLQDISEEDAIAEGIEFEFDTWRDYLMSGRTGNFVFENPIDSYNSLWESLNSKDCLSKNPFVFVYEFDNEFCKNKRMAKITSSPKQQS